MTSQAAKHPGADKAQKARAAEFAKQDYVTVIIAGQLFGLPISRVHDVFMPENMTQVPLSLPEVAGVLNLRGRIVTAIDMRRRLGLPPRAQTTGPMMAVGIEHKGESYGLVIDSVGEVLSLTEQTYEKNPVNLDPRWSRISDGVHRLKDRLLVILDVERVLEFGQNSQAA